MTDRFDSLEARLQELTVAVRTLTERVAELEAQPARPGELAAAAAVGEAPAAAATAREAADVPASGEPWEAEAELDEAALEEADAAAESEPADALDMLAAWRKSGQDAAIYVVIGRTLLIFSGAFLLRAITDLRILPGGAGILVGLVYATLWLWLADRAGRAQRLLSANAHGVAFCLIVAPLLWEASFGFKILQPPTAAAAVGLFAGGGLLVAWRRHLRTVAWIATLSGQLVALGLLLVTRHVTAPLLVVSLLCLVAIWLAYSRPWPGLRWLASAIAILAMLTMVLAIGSGKTPPESYQHVSHGELIGLSLLLCLLHLGSFAWRATRPEEPVGGFEIMASLGALIVGFGGAVYVSAARQAGVKGLGVLALLAALVWYGLALRTKKAKLPDLSSIYLGLVALVLTVAGTALITSGLTQALLWCLIGVGCALGARRLEPGVLPWHSAAYLTAAGVGTGLWASTLLALFSGTALPPLTLPAVLTALAATVSYLSQLGWLPLGPDDRWPQRLPRLLVALLALFALATAAVLLVAGLLGVTVSEQRPVVAAIRSGVLAASAVVLAYAGRSATRRELGWLAYAVLALGGMKLLVEDLRHRQSIALFVSFVLYGAAMIIAPRLLRRGQQPAAEPRGRPPEDRLPDGDDAEASDEGEPEAKI